MTDVEILKAARALIAEPEHWCKGTFQSNDAYCALGAPRSLLIKRRAWNDGVQWNRIVRLLSAARPAKAKTDRHGLPRFNDLPTTTHKMILNLYDRAIKAAEEAS